MLKQVAATQFSAIVAVVVVLIARAPSNGDQSLGPVFLLLFLGMALCWYMYSEKALQQEQIIYRLLKLENIKHVADEAEKNGL